MEGERERKRGWGREREEKRQREEREIRIEQDTWNGWLLQMPDEGQVGSYNPGICPSLGIELMGQCSKHQPGQ